MCRLGLQSRPRRGFFVIGWRKRVIHIEWRDVVVPAGHFNDLGVITHGSNYVHADGPEKAVEYLGRVRTNATHVYDGALTWPGSVGESEVMAQEMQSRISDALKEHAATEIAKLQRDTTKDQW